MIDIQNLSFSYKKEKVLKQLSLSIKAKELIGIIGPNGSGKSTLLKNISRVITPDAGMIYINNKQLNKLSANELALQLAVVPQDTSIKFDFTVYELVMMGRNPYQDRWGRVTQEDRNKVREALDLTDTLQFSDRSLNNLSGGERQRVIIARALAQDPAILLLDEPTSSLDINYQGEIFDLIAYLNREKELTTIIVSHDLNLASQYCQRLILLNRGEIFASGRPEDVLTEENISEVYNADVIIKENFISGKPYVAIIPNQNKFDLNKKATSFSIHLICGGGSAQKLLPKLNNMRVNITVGILNQGDSDWQLAKSCGAKVVEIAPFAYITSNDLERNEVELEKSDLIIVSDLPFGHGNIENLKQLLSVNDKDIYMLAERKIEEKDYTNGEATKIWNTLKQQKNVKIFAKARNLIETLEKDLNLNK
ncbi:MAG: heme ABC transporter ATP-binding protein [Bacillota bacterium]